MELHIDELTEAQRAIAVKFLAALIDGNSLTRFDFPEVDGDEFEAIADAVCDAFEPRH